MKRRLLKLGPFVALGPVFTILTAWLLLATSELHPVIALLPFGTSVQEGNGVRVIRQAVRTDQSFFAGRINLDAELMEGPPGESIEALLARAEKARLIPVEIFLLECGWPCTALRSRQ